MRKFSKLFFLKKKKLKNLQSTHAASYYSRLVPTAMKAAAVKNRTKIMSQRKRNQRSVDR